MEEKLYDEALEWCQQMITSNNLMLYRLQEFYASLFEASSRFMLPHESMISLFRHTHLRRFKKIHFQIANWAPSIVKLYTESPTNMSIIDIAIEFRIPPSLAARIILEHVMSFHPLMTTNEIKTTQSQKLNEQHEEPVDTEVHISKMTPSVKKAIRNALHDPMSFLGDSLVICPKYRHTLCTILDPSYTRNKLDPFTGVPHPSISDTYQLTNKLALDVWEAMEHDPMYGPRHDRLSHVVGVDYELALEDHLHSMNLPFETERELRERGASKTPDILFKTPLAIQLPRPRTPTEPTKLNLSEEWHIIHWVDSKGYFGDEFTHRNIVVPQAESYVHRFGPGLILYWLGHAPLSRLDHAGGDIFITAWSFPNSCLLPAKIHVEMGFPFIEESL